MKIVVGMVTEIVKLLRKHMNPEITQKLYKLACVNRWQCADYACHFYSPSHKNYGF